MCWVTQKMRETTFFLLCASTPLLLDALTLPPPTTPSPPPPLLLLNASCAAACTHDSPCVEACVAEQEAAAADFDPVNLLYALALLTLSGLFSGLTLGLMSLDPQGLKLVIAGGDPVEKQQAERILPLREQGNLLLCTLLLGNTLVNALLSILTASITSGVVGGILSTGFILIFGEIIPQSFCSRYGLAAGSKTVDVVRVFMFLMFVVAKPISMVLDRVLGAELGTVYSKNELKELIRAQAAQGGTGGGGKGGGGERGGGMGGMGGGGMGGGERDSHGQPAPPSPAQPGGGEREGIKQAEASYMCGALSMSERTVQQIMTRVDDVFGVLVSDKLDFDVMRRICASGYTRIPVFKDEARGEVVGLLTTKDLILVDPEDALPAEVLLAHCGRPVFTVWFDHPVNKMFADFKHRHTHLAFVQRVNDEDDSRDPFYELQGIVSLEDVLEELIQAEIVDESDVYVDNVSKKPVEVRQVELRRRTAWHNMLDPKQLNNRHLTAVELEAVSSFLVANVSAFAPALISSATLQLLLGRSAVRVVDDEYSADAAAAVDAAAASAAAAAAPSAAGAGAPSSAAASAAPRGRALRRSDERPSNHEGRSLFARGEPCPCCTVVLQGRLHIVCGEEGFESDRGPWTVLGAQSLRDPHYLADFTAVPMERTRVLYISHADYAQALQHQAAQEAAAHLAAAQHHQRGSVAGGPVVSAAAASGAVPRVECVVPGSR